MTSAMPRQLSWDNCLNYPASARIISSLDFKYRTSYNISFKQNYVTRNTPEKFRDFRETGPRLIFDWHVDSSANQTQNQKAIIGYCLLARAFKNLHEMYLHCLMIGLFPCLLDHLTAIIQVGLAWRTRNRRPFSVNHSCLVITSYYWISTRFC